MRQIFYIDKQSVGKPWTSASAVVSICLHSGKDQTPKAMPGEPLADNGSWPGVDWFQHLVIGDKRTCMCSVLCCQRFSDGQLRITARACRTLPFWACLSAVACLIVDPLLPPLGLSLHCTATSQLPALPCCFLAAPIWCLGWSQNKSKALHLNELASDSSEGSSNYTLIGSSSISNEHSYLISNRCVAQCMG